LEDGQHPGECGGGEAAEPAHEPFPINDPDLVEDDVSCLTGKSAGDTEGIGVPSRGERSDDERAEMVVEIVGGDDRAWARLADLPTARGAQIHEEYVTAVNLVDYFHSHASRSKRVDVG
jgi:hypothetical protein